MKSLFELMVWMMFLGLVVAAFLLVAMAVAALVVGALVWLSLAAAHDRVVARSAGIGYWRWWGDRFQRLLVALDEQRDESALGEGVRRRTIARLEAQTARLARRIPRERAHQGASAWARRHDERRLEELQTRLEREQEALFGRPAPPEGHHRVADSDREETVTVLSRAHEEGRLEADELEERIGAAHATTAYAQLEALVRDLRPDASGSRGGDHRVSDRDREGAVSVLRAALDEGRLSTDEFSERTQRAYGARSADEIASLLGDLPDSYPKRASFG